MTAAAFLTTVPKIGALVANTRLVAELPGEVRWAAVLGVLAVANMTIGNLAELAQTDVRRLLGWSTVSQVGYLLAAAAVTRLIDQGQPDLLFFLAGYALTNLAAFAVAAAEPDRRSLEEWAGFASMRLGLTAALVVALFGLVGTPPTAVFIGKITTLGATWDAGLAWPAVAVAANTAVSIFYYLRWIRAGLCSVPQPGAGVATGAGGRGGHRGTRRGGGHHRDGTGGRAALAYARPTVNTCPQPGESRTRLPLAITGEPATTAGTG